MSLPAVEVVARSRHVEAFDHGLGSFVQVATTASGRYEILTGNGWKGDVLHQHVLVFDRAQGTFHALPEASATTWPRPLPIWQLADLGDRLDTLSIITAWEPIRVAAGVDAFTVGERLYVPGRHALASVGMLVPVRSTPISAAPAPTPPPITTSIVERCDARDADACVAIAQSHFLAQPPNLPAFAMNLRRACEAGHGPSCRAVGVLLRAGSSGFPKDPSLGEVFELRAGARERSRLGPD